MSTIEAVASEPDIDKILQGFSNENDLLTAPCIITEESSPDTLSSLHYSGFFRQLLSYSPFSHDTRAGNTVHGLHHMQSLLYSQLSWDPSEQYRAKISGHAFYDTVYSAAKEEESSRQMHEHYNKEAELDEAYIQTDLSLSGRLTFGRQIINTGKSLLFKVNDQINPVDRREPGLILGPQEKLALLMTKADLDLRGWNLSAAAAHEFRADKIPVYGSDFYPFDFAAPELDKPSSFQDSQSYILSGEKSYKQVDVAIYGSSYLKERDYVGLSIEDKNRVVSRIHSLGGGLETARESWVFRAESAFLSGIEYYSFPEKSFNRLDTALGIEYGGFVNTILILEAIDRHIFHYPNTVTDDFNSPNENNFLWAFRASRSFLRSTLLLSFTSINGGIDFHQGSANRVTASYSVNDNTQLCLGLLLYANGDNYLTENIGDNHRMFFRFQYSF